MNRDENEQGDGTGFSIIDGGTDTEAGEFSERDIRVPEPSVFGVTADGDHTVSVPERVTGRPRIGLTVGEAEVFLSMTANLPPVGALLSVQETDGDYSALESAPASPGDYRSRTSTTTDTDTGESDSVLDTFRDVVWVVRIATSMTREAARYSLRSGARTGARMVRAAGTSRTLEEFITQSQEIAYEEMDRIGVNIGQEDTNKRRKRGSAEAARKSAAELRERGAMLLEMSADVEYDESVHPAYPHILDQISPDEARLLRFLVTEGPQPAVDILDSGWFPVSSELVAAGLSMVGTQAGCRYEGRTQAYLNNLKRLGLVWFSDESVENVRRYQLVEAQGHIKEAIDSCTRAKVVHRSIHLTPFGVDFCRACLPIQKISEDASSVYDVPPAMVEHKEPDNDRDGGRWDEDGDEVGSLPEDIRNPHTKDPWE